ncbi:MAG: Ldh family oxidoreductase [Dehalococcoidia bacterium]
MVLEYMKVPEEEAVYVGHPELKALVSAVFQRLGMPQEEADIAADVLVLADLRGVDTHGVSHNPRVNYVPGLREGRINPRPQVRIVRETPATALLDGDRGMGHVVAYRAMEVAIRKAREAGGAFVSVRNSTHLGMAAYFAMMALPHDMIGIAISNSPPSVLPLYGRENMLGTNPLSVAAPAKEEPPFVLDMATSTVAMGKVWLAQRLGVPLRLGWAADAEGRPVTDPQVAAEARRLLPLGGERETGGHKGYGLAVMVDILCGVLSGYGYGSILPPRTHAHLLAAINISAIQPAEEFKEMMDRMIRALRSTPKAAGHDRIWVAGEPEHEILQERLVKGIPLQRQVVDYWNHLARELGIERQL